MPIGVPRIIYCWGEELPAQWTDIYNFIFRRRMIFLMQYLDDELCNQICGLLINIHMEDRSKDLEKKEMENSGLFQNPTRQKRKDDGNSPVSSKSSSNAMDLFGSSLSNDGLIEDLFISENDLSIEENDRLERYTLQKMTLDWLNWNAQFFDYGEEPYLFYLAQILSEDFGRNEGRLLYENRGDDYELRRSASLLKKALNSSGSNDPFDPKSFDTELSQLKAFDLYSPFRLLSDWTPDFNSVGLSDEKRQKLAKKLQLLRKDGQTQNPNENLWRFVSNFAEKDLWSKYSESSGRMETSEKALASKQLRRDFSSGKKLGKSALSPQSYLSPNASNESYMEFRDYYKKQTETSLGEDEAKKVFVVINSFGGSVGNGITVHDALQFIKAGSLTLGLGVAASAASLVLAGGTIGERYVTEGCHVMIHQPEGGLSGQASDIWIDSQEIMKIRLDVAEIYSLATYRPRHKILRDLDRDFYLTATETIFYGLADEIATNEVMHEIIEMTSKVWDSHDSQQQRLLESRKSATSGADTQTQN